MIKYGYGHIGVLLGSFEYLHNPIKKFNESIEKSSRARTDFDLTILTHPYITNSSSENDRAPITGRTIDEIRSDLSMLKILGWTE